MTNAAAIDYRQLAQAMLGQLGGGAQLKAFPSATPNAVPGHGPGGLFSTPGLSKPVFSAMALPGAGLAARLPVRASNEMNPLHAVVTGVDASSGTEPNGVCDDPPQAGILRSCTLTYTYGRFSRQSRVFDITRFGKMNNRGEFLDLAVQNPPAANDNPLVPTVPGDVTLQGAIKGDIAKGLFELGVAFTRDFARKTFSGNPVNNTAGGGYKEFRGLDMLINTGFVDAVNGTTTCPAVDSLIQNFGGANIANSPQLTVNLVVAMYHQLKRRASMLGLDPVTWGIAMRSTLFYELTSIWPCAYNTTNCSNAQVGADAQIQMRDDMRTNKYLLIDGERVEVIVDEAITETETAVNSGTFQSDIYFVPLRILGSIAALFWEFFDYSGPGAALDAARIFSPTGMFSVSDGGRFIWHRKPANNWCVQMLALTEPRLVLETPFLAARLLNLQYTPRLIDRSAWPDERGFVAGGVAAR